jgi:hypothetical protein
MNVRYTMLGEHRRIVAQLLESIFHRFRRKNFGTENSGAEASNFLFAHKCVAMTRNEQICGVASNIDDPSEK